MCSEFHGTELPGQGWGRREVVCVWVRGCSQGLIRLGSRLEDCAVLLSLSRVSYKWEGLELFWPFTQIRFPGEGELTISKVSCQGRGIASLERHVVDFFGSPLPSTKQRYMVIRGVLRGGGWAGARCLPLRASLWKGCCERATKCCGQGVPWDSVLSGLWDAPLARRIPHLKMKTGTTVPGNTHLKHLWELQARSLTAWPRTPISTELLCF